MRLKCTLFCSLSGLSTSAESTEVQSSESRSADTTQLGRLDFKHFNVERLLRHGQPLLAAARSSAEYDLPSLATDPAFAGLDRKEQAAK